MPESKTHDRPKLEGNEVSSGRRIPSDVDTTTPGKQSPEMDLIPPDECERHAPDSEVPIASINENSKSSVTLPSLDLPSPVGPGEMSTDIMNVIRKVIRQEYKRLDTNATAIASKAYAHVNPTGLDIVPGDCDSGLPQTEVVMTKGTRDQKSDEDADRTLVATRTPTSTTPIASSSFLPPPSSLSASTPRSVLHQAVGEEFGLARSGGVYESNDNIWLLQSPSAGQASTSASTATADKAPWGLHRRFSSLGAEYGNGWGVLFTEEGFPTTRCGEVFRGLARCLVSSVAIW
jgi:hypothetical protein